MSLAQMSEVLFYFADLRFCDNDVHQGGVSWPEVGVKGFLFVSLPVPTFLKRCRGESVSWRYNALPSLTSSREVLQGTALNMDHGFQIYGWWYRWENQQEISMQEIDIWGINGARTMRYGRRAIWGRKIYGSLQRCLSLDIEDLGCRNIMLNESTEMNQIRLDLRWEMLPYIGMCEVHRGGMRWGYCSFNQSWIHHCGRFRLLDRVYQMEMIYLCWMAFLISLLTWYFVAFLCPSWILPSWHLIQSVIPSLSQSSSSTSRSPSIILGKSSSSSILDLFRHLHHTSLTSSYCDVDVSTIQILVQSVALYLSRQISIFKSNQIETYRGRNVFFSFEPRTTVHAF